MKKISTLALATLTSVAAASVVAPQAGAAERVVRGPQWEDEPSVTVTDNTSPAVDAVEDIEVVELPQEDPERAEPTRVVRGPQWEGQITKPKAPPASAGGAQAVPETTVSAPTTTPAPAPAPAPAQPVYTDHRAEVSPSLVNAVATQPAPDSATTVATEQAPPAPAPVTTAKPVADDFVQVSETYQAVAPAPATAPAAKAELPQPSAPAGGGNRATVTITYPGGVAAVNAVDNTQGRVEVVTTHTHGGTTVTDTWVSQATHTTWNIQRNGYEVANLTVPAGFERIAEDLGAQAEAAGINPFAQPYGRHALRVAGIEIAGELKQA